MGSHFQLQYHLKTAIQEGMLPHPTGILHSSFPFKTTASGEMPNTISATEFDLQEITRYKQNPDASQ